MGECTPWQGRTQSKGYGYVTHAGRSVLAHRLAYALHHGLDVFTMGGTVMHSCDIRLCVNPAHLSLGTAKMNTLDMLQKGRHAHAETHPSSKLSNAAVLYIREHYVRGTPRKPGNSKELQRMFNVGKSTISAVVNNTSRKEG